MTPGQGFLDEEEESSEDLFQKLLEYASDEEDIKMIKKYRDDSLDLDNGDHRWKKPSLSLACLYYEGFTNYDLNYDVLKQCDFDYQKTLLFLHEIHRDHLLIGSVEDEFYSRLRKNRDLSSD